MSIIDRLSQVKKKINQAAKRVGRNPKEVKLVVAGKYADSQQTLRLIEAGAKIIGENREQDLRKKFSTIGSKVQWHFIGHLQRNKVKSVIRMVSMVHSLDSFKLAVELEKQLLRQHKKLPSLIQVNTSAEKSKYGVLPQDTLSLAVKCSQFNNLKIVGLMTMGKLVRDPQENRKNFKSLRRLLKEIRQQKFPRASKYKHLSMGTTQDYQVAIEEGATFVRIGSAIFT